MRRTKGNIRKLGKIIRGGREGGPQDQCSNSEEMVVDDEEVAAHGMCHDFNWTLTNLVLNRKSI